MGNNVIADSIVTVLKWRAINQPDRLAYRFLVDGENHEICISYLELDQRARAIASVMQKNGKKGDRVILLYPPGIDFIVSFFGSLYAGITAVPLYPPHPARITKTISATLRVIADSAPSIVLSDRQMIEVITKNKDIGYKFEKLKMLSTDQLDIDDYSRSFEETVINEDTIAFLQYTSGSTSTPKGVMISHGNLVSNHRIIEKSLGLSEDSRGVYWLPFYHDMGLIGGILQSVFTGYPSTLLPHMMFLQKPVRWLRAISKYKGTVTGSPNFAYELCLRKVKPEDIESFDLSHWKVALNGAEPIHDKTLNEFADTFTKCGFDKKSFVPSYGLAEATLMVTGGPFGRESISKNLNKIELEQNKIKFSDYPNIGTTTFVACGQNVGQQSIKIVDPDSITECANDKIGEIWINGPCVGKGYWNNTKTTQEIFKAKIPGDDKFYLRTGDLGFLLDDELYVTGRIKNMIIIEGRNYYPHDIQRVIEQSHYAIIPSGTAVFSVSDLNTEQIVVVVETQYKLVDDKVELEVAIRRSLSEVFTLKIHDIRFIIPGSLPRTTSGKIKHFECKTHYLNNSLKELTLV